MNNQFYCKSAGQAIVLHAITEAKIEIPVESRNKLIDLIDNFLETRDKDQEHKGRKLGLREAILLIGYKLEEL